jgi:hypothetical protein
MKKQQPQFSLDLKGTGTKKQLIDSLKTIISQLTASEAITQASISNRAIDCKFRLTPESFYSLTCAYLKANYGLEAGDIGFTVKNAIAEIANESTPEQYVLWYAGKYGLTPHDKVDISQIMLFAKSIGINVAKK